MSRHRRQQRRRARRWPYDWNPKNLDAFLARGWYYKPAQKQIDERGRVQYLLRRPFVFLPADRAPWCDPTRRT